MTGGPGIMRSGISSATIAASHFDGAQLSQNWAPGGAITASQPWLVAADVAELAAHHLPTILDLKVGFPPGGSEFDTAWIDWISPIHATASSMATGAGVWITVPAINGLAHLAEATGFPILLRDTEVPISVSAWATLFQSELPLTVRGMVPGVSALFPLEGTVAEATAAIARAVRNRVI
jgi:hypothetical protein